MLYITGDTHADFRRFSTDNFPEQKDMTRDDAVIILGDFGGIWDVEKSSKRELYWLDWLESKPFTLCYVDGNHENFDRYYEGEFPIVDFHGGKAHKIRENIYHLMRGYIFDFEGKKFFAFGGASSHDIDDGILDPCNYESNEDFIKVYRLWEKRNKMFRVNHLSWWKEELPSQEEMDFGEETLRNVNYEVDYVISHCLPQDIAFAAGYRGVDCLTMYFNKLLQNGLKFTSWWCGHYHREDRIMGKFNILYEHIVRLL